MIFLKNKILNKNVLKKAFIVLFSGGIFFLGAYAYLDYNINKQATKTEEKDYSVPYKNIPDNAGIAFALPNGSAVLCYLDFENTCIKVLNIEDYDRNNSTYYGYDVDYNVQTDYDFICGIIDRVGGVSIEINDEIMRYTGVQVIDLISSDYDSNIKNQIIAQIFDCISKNNFSNDDFVYIIENSENDLSIVDCIYWLDYIGEMVKKISLVN